MGWEEERLRNDLCALIKGLSRSITVRSYETSGRSWPLVQCQIIGL